MISPKVFKNAGCLCYLQLMFPTFLNTLKRATFGSTLPPPTVLFSIYFLNIFQKTLNVCYWEIFDIYPPQLPRTELPNIS